MPAIRQKITNELNRICQSSSSHFAALALALPNERRFRWLYACGNRNERYKRMIVKPGGGPDGLALRTGKPVLWNGQTDHSDKAIHESPLFTAENLQAAAMIPLFKGNEVVGMLLMARRTSDAYTNLDLVYFQEQLPHLSEIVS